MPSYVEVQECLVVTIGVDVPGDNTPPANKNTSNKGKRQ